MAARGDGELLGAWQAGDAAAGEAFVDRHFDAITRFFRNKVCSEDDVAELVGQTFLGCTASKDRWRGEAGARQFLYAIAGNVLRKYIRGRYKRKSEALDFAAVCVQDCEGASMSSIVAHRREARCLVQALREIAVEDQIVLELMYFEGLSGSEAAALLGVPEGTVRGRIARGRQRLRERVAALLAAAPAAPTVDVTPEQLEAWARELRRQHGRE
ncbi:RNA polymerase sigma factor [Nannocystis pusilla]|uniref:RNA polymerase sigma factor n=1 Tax=Nannocystis pusilla TaxID=889268 RepID=A0A9X3EK37_9BACT|nr:RNA polymerase sigma factor [Nannocystis pusilla]